LEAIRVPSKKNVEQTYRFTISPQDASLTEARIRKLLAQATAEAEKEAQEKGSGVAATSGLEGGFGGVGEITALLILAAKSATGAKVIAAAGAGAKIVGKAALGGVGAAGGKLFFDKYLAPRLRKLNLLPSNLKVVEKTAKRVPRKKPGKPKRG